MALTKKEKAEQKAAAIEQLRNGYAAVRPGQTLKTLCTHVARSGMSRRIKVLVAVPGDPNAEYQEDRDPQVVDLSWLVAKATGYQYHEGDAAVVMGGCGMDMGYALVHELGRVLFPDGGPVDQSQRASQEKRAGNSVERDGGYLLKHRWL